MASVGLGRAWSPPAVGARVLLPTRAASWGLSQAPFLRTKSPIMLGVWLPEQELGNEKGRLHRPPMGDPRQGQGLGVLGARDSPGQAPLLRRSP